MRIPSTIEKNTFEVYDSSKHKPSGSSAQNVKHAIRSDDFQWDKDVVKPLAELCVKCLADYWEEHPVLDEIVSSVDRCHLLEILPLDLPLEVTVPRIHYEIYWSRCYLNRWPEELPEPHTLKESKMSFNGVDNKGDANNRMENECNGLSPDSHEQPGTIDLDEGENDKRSMNTSESDNDSTVKKTWKQYYLEKHISNFIETLKPEDYDAEQIKEITDLCSPYVQKIDVNQLLCATSSSNRIPLNSIFTGFPNLRELQLCFKQTYIGENFTWNVLKAPTQNVKLLAKGLEKSNLRCLRLINSDIDSAKSIIIMKSLLKHNKIRIIDLSHCNIGDRGMIGLAKFCLLCPVEKILVVNNNIGARGAHAISYAISQTECNLANIDMKLNIIKDEGADVLLRILASKSCKVSHIDLSACGITRNVENLRNVLEYSKNLQSINLSNNKFGEEMGKKILESLTKNGNVRTMNIRMCNISSDTEYKIRNQLLFNQKRRQKQSFFHQTITDFKQEHYSFDEEIVSCLHNIFD